MICEHRQFNKAPVLRTGRFLVATKLSLPGDDHPARESQNYLKFPAHLFQHWNGYNIALPLHDPTPVSAVVPQFFGYYVPCSNSTKGYRSPIPFIEHCGEPIEAQKSSTGDRRECAVPLPPRRTPT
ncbi:hypothetical protein BS17DRAFT_787869 [Gyrodon lividus]|nr:hypothetical protein BS17DRAFT_787869 [Gyrodon lividus]